MTIGTSTVRRPGVRGLTARFVRCVVPQVPRRTKQVGARFPQRDLHGLVLGRRRVGIPGLVGNAAPVSPISRVCGSQLSGTCNTRLRPTGGSRKLEGVDRDGVRIRRVA